MKKAGYDVGIEIISNSDNEEGLESLENELKRMQPIGKIKNDITKIGVVYEPNKDILGTYLRLSESTEKLIPTKNAKKKKCRSPRSY